MLKEYWKKIRGYEEYFQSSKAKKEEWNKKIENISDQIDELLSARVIVFPVSFENIFEIDIEDIKIKEFSDVDDFEKWLKEKAKNGKYLLVHNVYKEFLLYIKEKDVIWVMDIDSIFPPVKVINITSS